MKTTMVAPDKCLGCGCELDCVSDLTEDHTPSPGDITICLRCGHVMAFDKDLKVRPLTDAEMLEVAGNPEILRIQQARGKVMKDESR